ncbi:PLP-dependent aminotransferase family protein [Cupriavidus sp. 2TAF22]|uniref:MocR-like pyridoxine biosynthesis transcription factor PdxR n=1 Tax=unclassified Cupriavidus TaxID=2640874 RepID=UPI003F930211
MRHAKDIELAIAARPEGASLQRWLYTEISSAILAGRLAPGARLPPTRDIASRYGVSRGTVIGVFAQLAAEGYLSARVGRGSFVAAELPERRPAPAVRADDLRRRSGGAGAPASSAPLPAALSMRGERLARSPFRVEGRALQAPAFRLSQPDLRAFPSEIWARIAAKRARQGHGALLGDGEAQGYRPLREAIADNLRVARGIACTADNILMVGSVQQVLDLAARLLLDPGDAVWMEDPGYPGARMVLEAAGAAVAGIPVDAGGLDVAAGRASAPGARMAYVTAGRQAPLGPPLALERRLALLAWAGAAGAIVIEDDYDSEYRFEGPPLAALKSLDQAGSVIYCGTFSKLLFPALRIAYAVLPDHLVAPFARALSLTARHIPLEPQATLHAFIADGHFGRHMRRMRLLYGERAQALRIAADRHLHGALHLPAILAGLDAPAFLPPGTDDAMVARLAAEAGLEVRPMSYYAVERPAPPGLVLGFASVDAAKIHAGARTLAAVLARMKPGRT